MKDKVITALLAFFLGAIGIHRFYLGQTGLGFLYLIFCWTFIPAIIAFIDCILFLIMSQESFDAKYNKAQFTNQIVNQYVPPSPSRDVASDIERLYTLKEKGIITNEEFEQSKRKLL